MSHPKKERTLVVIKPDGIQRVLAGEIINRFERIGLKIVAMKMVVPTEAPEMLAVPRSSPGALGFPRYAVTVSVPAAPGPGMVQS